MIYDINIYYKKKNIESNMKYLFIVLKYIINFNKFFLIILLFKYKILN